MNRRGSSLNVRSEARFLKLRLRELFPKEVCLRHRKRNCRVEHYQNKADDHYGREPHIGRRLMHLSEKQFYQGPTANKLTLRLKDHFKEHEIERILDEKQYFFGGEELCEKLMRTQPQSPRNTPLGRSPASASAKRMRTTECQASCAPRAQPSKQAHQRVQERRHEQDWQQEMRTNDYLFYQQHCKQKYLSQYKQSKSALAQECQRQKQQKLEKVRQRLMSCEAQLQESQELRGLEAELKQICWERTKQRSTAKS